MLDLLVIGGGINGTAIARDAAGRGLSVLLVEADDLAAHTSSASTKLIHGGLRYLELYDFRLVREALLEREVMLQSAPHLVTPLRFILPLRRGSRPWWLVRAGLLLYDALARGTRLPRSRTMRLGTPLKAAVRRGFAYWDAWVDDARLVVLNARDAADRGAEIRTGTRLVSARRQGGLWHAELLRDGVAGQATARIIVNAAGPWVGEVLAGALGHAAGSTVRLVRGSHLIVPRLFAGDDAYILQQPDRRIVFAIPYERDFTLIGTTDVAVTDPGDAVISNEERDYLLAATNRWFDRQRTSADIVATYSGIRSLFDDGAGEARAVTRDYHLEADPAAGLLSVFGGKITTARALAEAALDRLAPHTTAWTRHATLPGGDLGTDRATFIDATTQLHPWLDPQIVRRMAGAYGTHLPRIIGDATSPEHLGEDFGSGLTAREVEYLVTQEWARTADDILQRRTKLGLYLTEQQTDRLAAYLASR